MKNIIQKLTTGLLCGLSLLGYSQAEARGGSATVGTAALGSKRHCFTEDYGGIRNTCSTRETWVLPAITETSGPPTFVVTAGGMSPGTNNNVTCRTWSVDSTGGNARWSSSASTVNYNGTTQSLNMSINAHQYGALYVLCDMDPSMLVLNYYYW